MIPAWNILAVHGDLMLALRLILILILFFYINFESVLPLAIFLHDANIVKRFNIQQTDKMIISCRK